MENVQKRLLRNVYEDYESKLATLEVQRYRFIATHIYKAVNKFSPIYIQELFEIKDLVYNVRDPIRTKVSKCASVTYGLKSLRFLGNMIWNSLPINIKMSESLCSFRKKIQAYKGITHTQNIWLSESQPN